MELGRNKAGRSALGAEDGNRGIGRHLMQENRK